MVSSIDVDAYFIRHAQSHWNAEGSHIIGGRSNETPLSDLGIEQARTLGSFLLSEKITPYLVYVSPAVRTVETARLALEEMGLSPEIITDDDLQEMDQGEWVGLVRSKVYTPEVITEMEELGLDFKAPGGESMRETGLRVFNRLESITADLPVSDEPLNIFVFGHGVATKCLAGYLNGWTRQQTFETSTPNTSISLFRQREGQWKVEYIGRLPS